MNAMPLPPALLLLLLLPPQPALPDGSSAILASCNASDPAQRWQLRAGWGANATLVNRAIQGPAAVKCLAVAYGSDVVGEWSCAADPPTRDFNQQWAQNGSGTPIRGFTAARQPGLCLTAAAATAGAAITVQPCPSPVVGGGAVDWLATERQGIRLGAMELCLSTPLAAPPPPAPVPPAPTAAEGNITVTVDWDEHIGSCNTAATILTTVMPFAGRTDFGGPFDAYYTALGDLGTEYTRLLPWFPNPKVVVAELAPPECTATQPATNWDSELLDQVVADFMSAVCGTDAASGGCIAGRSVAMQLSTMPSWLFVGGANATGLPANPWNTTEPIGLDYGNPSGGSVLVDHTCRELASYVRRLYSWFTAGGFHDDCGHFHASGLRYKWELLSIFNEDERHLQPGLGVAYTTCFDAIKAELAKVNPAQVLVGPEICFPMPWGVQEGPMQWVRHFMNGSNHADGMAPAVVSYHLGLRGTSNSDGTSAHAAYFTQWDLFWNSTILTFESWRRTEAEARAAAAGGAASAPSATEFALDELCPFVADWCDCTGAESLCGGVAFPTGWSGCPNWENQSLARGDPDLSHRAGIGMNKRTLGWNAAGAVFAYGFGQLATLGYKFVGLDQLLGGTWPDNEAPAGSMDWQTGQVTAKYWVVKLLASSVGSKARKTLFNATTSNPSLGYALAYTVATASHGNGTRGLLLVNKQPKPVTIRIAGVTAGVATCVDGAEMPQTPGMAPPVAKQIGADGLFQLGAFGVAVVSDLEMVGRGSSSGLR